MLQYLFQSSICPFSYISTEANLGMVQFTSDGPSTAKVFRRRNDKTAARACGYNEAELETNYEVIPENMQAVYVNEREEGQHEAHSLINHVSVCVNNTPEANYEVVMDKTKSAYVNETEESGYQALLPVNQDAVYVNKTPEGYYEALATNNTESVLVSHEQH